MYVYTCACMYTRVHVCVCVYVCVHALHVCVEKCKAIENFPMPLILLSFGSLAYGGSETLSLQDWATGKFT